MARPFSALRAFLATEAAGGVLLMAAAAAALIVANSRLGPGYAALLHVQLGPLSVAHWINDALMALFFLLVGLEIKREFRDGHLATWPDRVLPGVAALAGMAAPAMVYLILAGHVPGLARGWAIPAATDIAFAVGVLALLGRRVPASLKLFLTTVAIVDDMGAVAIIALFYSGGLNLVALMAAAAIFAVMLLLGRRGVASLSVYLALGAALWVAIHLSGVHATVAGVLTAFAVPLRRSHARPDDALSPLHRLEHRLAPWVGFGIVPLFGFANAGLSFAGMGWQALADPLTLGIALGLFVGKQAGVLAAVWIAAATGLAPPPRGARWRQVHGVAILCGIGFTMSLFIGGLAFADPAHMAAVKLGVLAGSLLSALSGYAVLRFAR
ncbi:Na+/H+ antiporter NhaA [Sphingomonas quercus]|uniref:Na(+)/H(+) antiporter NhaA n=1 Tax=Sphingomonas quercus TaxID=2842451 RepID=A0ABS6BIL3_9SPHN|nr:Na+/H+ antiporter NhaA [Sphingomonas quercus]MBU3077064.1 Na+/H+ antiporter NhaA [Sphingomonas quercus]